MTTQNPATGSNLRAPVHMSRKEFNCFLFDLYETEDENDLRADAVYESNDFYVEVFEKSPDGLLIAIHHGHWGFNYQKVDVLRPALDGQVSSAAQGEVAK